MLGLLGRTQEPPTQAQHLVPTPTKRVGSWGSAAQGFRDTLEEAEESAKALSEREPHNKYCVEIVMGAPGNPTRGNPTYKAGKKIEHMNRDQRTTKA